jgi:hypothetical protein
MPCPEQVFDVSIQSDHWHSEKGLVGSGGWRIVSVSWWVLADSALIALLLPSKSIAQTLSPASC